MQSQPCRISRSTTATPSAPAAPVTSAVFLPFSSTIGYHSLLKRVIMPTLSPTFAASACHAVLRIHQCRRTGLRPLSRAFYRPAANQRTSAGDLPGMRLAGQTPDLAAECRLGQGSPAQRIQYREGRLHAVQENRQGGLREDGGERTRYHQERLKKALKAIADAAEGVRLCSKSSCARHVHCGFCTEPAPDDDPGATTFSRALMRL